MHVGLFLDRDGTINEEVEYLTSPDEIRLIPGSADAIREANELGLKVFIVTNQSGVARGVLSETRLDEIHTELLRMLGESNAHIDAVYYCPHLPDRGDPPYRAECDCRKPSPGMLLRASREYGVDLKKSFVIGDRLIDVQTGNNIGAKSVLVLTGYGKEEARRLEGSAARADHVAEDLRGALQFVRHELDHQRTPTP